MFIHMYISIYTCIIQAAADIQRVFRGFLTRLLIRDPDRHAVHIAKRATTTIATRQQQQHHHISHKIQSEPSKHTHFSQDNNKLDTKGHNSDPDEMIIDPTYNTATATSASASSAIRKRKGTEIRSNSTSSTLTAWLSEPEPAQLRSQYRTAYTQKHQLKAQLKRFDEEFKHVHGRLPTRREKEVS